MIVESGTCCATQCATQAVPQATHLLEGNEDRCVERQTGMTAWRHPSHPHSRGNQFMLRASHVASAVVASALFASAASSSSINDRLGPISLGKNSNEQSLAQILDGLTNPATPGIDVVNDQSNAAIFTNMGGSSIATFVIEVAGYADGNEFGLYKFGDKDNTAMIFGGSNVAADALEVSFLGNGDVLVDGSLVASDFGNDFGFYIHTKAGDWFYTEDDLNGGDAQAMIYEGSGVAGGTEFEIGGKTVEFGPDSVLIAFEDLVLGRSDRDYQDLVVIVDDVRPSSPMPEPGGALVFGVGLLITSRTLRGQRRP